MWLEWINILSVQGFSFFLLIFLVGYFFVEITLWRVYDHIFSFEKHKNSLFHSIVHYVFWWIVLNVTMFEITASNPKLGNSLMGMINAAGKLSKALGFEKGGIGLESQLVIFSIGYFITIITILLVFSLLLRTDKVTFWVAETISKIVDKKQKRKIKKKLSL